MPATDFAPYLPDAIAAKLRGAMSPKWADPARYTRRAKTDHIVLHYAATGARAVTAKEINEWHNQRGFVAIGYHFVVDRDGSWEVGRPLWAAGAGVKGHNSRTVHFCFAGGPLKGEAGEMTDAQNATLVALMHAVLRVYPAATVLGHRDMAGTNTDCPGLDARIWATQNGLPPARLNTRAGERVAETDARTAYLQRLLTKAGHYTGPDDGIAGPSTRAAVLAYQRARGLAQSGRFDTATVARLRLDVEQASPADRPADLPSVDGPPEGLEREGATSTTNIAAVAAGGAGVLQALGGLAPWLAAALVVVTVLSALWIIRERQRYARAARGEYRRDSWSDMRAWVTRQFDGYTGVAA